MHKYTGKLGKLLAAVSTAAVMMSLLTAEACAAGADVPIDETNFPDPNFRNYVSSQFDTNQDNILAEAERNAVTHINVHEQGYFGSERH